MSPPDQDEALPDSNEPGPQTASFSDVDSAYGSDIASSTTSLMSREFLFEKRNGRTYHGFRSDLGYVLPNDEPEKDRLDMQFWAIHDAFDIKYFLAPIGDNPQHIIDIGTGTGVWVIDVADLYPGATVTGTDLSPIQPDWVPPNATFELHDCKQMPWDFTKTFDLIHTQLLNAFAIRDWEEFYRECYNNLRPGGWVESHEFDLMVRSPDDSLPKDSAIVKWLLQWDIGAGGGFRLTGQDLAAAMEKAGFVDIVVKETRLPIGIWDREHLTAGILNLTAMTEHIEGLSARIWLDRFGLTEEEMRAQTDPVVREWRTRSIHTYWPMSVLPYFPSLSKWLTLFV
jgi:SAM-dependent methyltransferase